MSDTENRSDAPAPEGEVIPSAPIQSDAAATVAPAKPANRIADSSFEAAHAELPPLSALAADAPVATVESGSAAVSGARRGRGRGAPAGKSASGQPAKVAFGVVENPADLTENLSGKHAQGYADQPPRREREERKPYVAPAAREAAESVAAPEAAEAVEASESSEAVAETRAPSAPKEFVPPVSEGTRKADLNPEAERQAREERRQRDDRPRGDRPQGEGRNDERPRGERRQPAQGGEFRGEPQPRGERREFRENREPRENREGGQRQDRGERRDERRDNNRGEQRNRPGRVTIEAPKIPVQEPTTFLGKLFRAIAQKLWGVPAAKDLAFDSVSRPITPHSKEWQFNRGQQRRDGRPGDNRGDRGNGGNNGGQRREFRHGNGNQGGDRNPNRDGRHRPHSRGGNHHQGGRDGGPRA